MNRLSSEGSILALDNVTKRYIDGKSERTVLDGACGEFFPGRITAVLGRSGAGKSTLLNLIAGIEAPTSGRVLFNGAEVPKGDKKGAEFRRKNIGFVFQSFYLIPHMTVRENIQLALEISGQEADAHPSPDELMERLGIKHLSNDYPVTLSGGEQQRAAIARALIHKPSIILADEPTGNLDGATALQILQLFRETMAGGNQAILMATHDHKALDFCDDRLELSKGRLAQLAA